MVLESGRRLSTLWGGGGHRWAHLRGAADAHQLHFDMDETRLRRGRGSYVRRHPVRVKLSTKLWCCGLHYFSSGHRLREQLLAAPHMSPCLQGSYLRFWLLNFL